MNLRINHPCARGPADGVLISPERMLRGESMGINIGIREMEAESALCRGMRSEIVKAKVDGIAGFEDVSEYDTLVTLEKARGLFPDWEGFTKRNRIGDDVDAVYLTKVRDAGDIALLAPFKEKRFTGWVPLEGLSDERREAVLAASRPENRVNGWDLAGFDEMKEICGRCKLSWDKGRGCIGTFGPDNSLLPGIAARHGCAIIAAVPESAAAGRIHTPAEAAVMLEEVEKLTAVLPDEGKMMVRRYSGPLERLGAVGRISVEEGCGFYFF
jgi:hypothetical protein